MFVPTSSFIGGERRSAYSAFRSCRNHQAWRRPSPGAPAASRLSAPLRMLATSSRASSKTHSLGVHTTEGMVQATGRFLMVKLEQLESQTASGIVITSTAKERPSRGTVVSVGEGAMHPNAAIRVPMPVKVGDTVAFVSFGGTDVKFDDEEHTFVTIDDVLCVVNRRSEEDVSACQPLFDRILVRVDKPKEERSVGGIFVAGKDAGEETLAGEVVAMGPGRFQVNGEYEPMPFKLGETVMFRKYAGSELKIGGKEYLAVRAADVMVKWQSPKA